MLVTDKVAILIERMMLKPIVVLSMVVPMIFMSDKMLIFGQSTHNSSSSLQIGYLTSSWTLDRNMMPMPLLAYILTSGPLGAASPTSAETWVPN